MTMISHSNMLESSTIPAEKPSTGDLASSTRRRRQSARGSEIVQYQKQQQQEQDRAVPFSCLASSNAARSRSVMATATTTDTRADH